MKVLMIGMGMVAQAHVLALRDNEVGLRLCAVLGRDTSRTEHFAQKAAKELGYPVAGCTTWKDAVAHAPDMALVLTPPNARQDYAALLATAGIPTLMEKPLERSHAGAQAVADLYAQAQVPLGLCFQHRTRASVRSLKHKLETGALGAIVHVEMRVPWWRDQAYYDAPGRGSYARDGGGVMINQAIHTLDLALWLAGPISDVQALMRTSPLHRMQAEDIAAGLLTFACGASGVLSATTAAYPGGAESIAITTTRAQATLVGDDLRIDWIDGYQEAVAQSATGTGGGADPMAFTHAWHQSIVEDFANTMRSGTQPIAPPEGALHVHAVIEAMEKAARSGERTQVLS